MRACLICALLACVGCSSTMSYSPPAVDELMAQAELPTPKQQHPCLSWDLRGEQQTPFSKSLYILNEQGRLVRESSRYFGEGFPYKLTSDQEATKRLSSYSRELEYDEQGQLTTLKERGLSELLSTTTFTYDEAKRLTQSERLDVGGRVIGRQTFVYDDKGRVAVERINPDDQGHARQIIVHHYADLEPPSLEGLVADQIIIYAHREDGKLTQIEQASPQRRLLATFIYGARAELLREERPHAQVSFTYDEQLRLQIREVSQGQQTVERVTYHYDRAGNLIWSHAEDISGQSRWIVNDYRCQKPQVKP